MRGRVELPEGRWGSEDGAGASLSRSRSPAHLTFSLLRVLTRSSLSSPCAQCAPSSRPSSRTTRTSARPPLRPSRARGSRAAALSSTSSGGGSCSLCVGRSEREGEQGSVGGAGSARDPGWARRAAGRVGAGRARRQGPREGGVTSLCLLLSNLFCSRTRSRRDGLERRASERASKVRRPLEPCEHSPQLGKDRPCTASHLT